MITKNKIYKIVTEVLNKHNLKLLDEISLKQLKQKYPRYSDEIDDLEKRNIEQKYYEYIIMKFSERSNTLSSSYNLDNIISIVSKFDNLLKKNQFDKLIKSGKMDLKQKDINYWNKKSFNELLTFVNNVSKSEEVLSKQKVELGDSKVIYESQRFIIAAPLSKNDANEIGKNTKWCISATDPEYWHWWFDYINGNIKHINGKSIFVCFIDKYKDPFHYDLAKIAFRFTINTKTFKHTFGDAWNVEDTGYGKLKDPGIKFKRKQIHEHLKEELGIEWNKLWKMIIQYAINANFIDEENEREDEESWVMFDVGDSVFVPEDIMDGLSFENNFSKIEKKLYEFFLSFFKEKISNLENPSQNSERYVKFFPEFCKSIVKFCEYFADEVPAKQEATVYRTDWDEDVGQTLDVSFQIAYDKYWDHFKKDIKEILEDVLYKQNHFFSLTTINNMDVALMNGISNIFIGYFSISNSTILYSSEVEGH